jgi:hypothetical protein
VHGTGVTKTAKRTGMPSTNIALVGEGGQPLGSKARSEITASDTYHSVFVLVITPQKELLLRTLDSGKLSATGMAICLAEEQPEDAAKRALPWPSLLHHLGDQLYTLPGQKTYGSVFYAVSEPPEDAAYTTLSAQEVTEQQLTPALAAIWAQYRHLLPIDQNA